MARLFLCLYLPALPLQALAYSGPEGVSAAFAETAPLVVVEREARQTRIVARNRLAARAGIAPGQTLAQAHALADPLLVLPRDPVRERALLERLAAALSAFTPNIHLHAARASLLCEVAASLRLYGGIEGLCHALTQATTPLVARTHLVVAPSARAADWLARAHRELIATTALEDWLEALPLACTDWPPQLLETLAGLNLHTVGEVDRLPRAELALRFGEALLVALDQAYGRCEEALEWWQPATVFRTHIDFLEPARERAHWQAGLSALLAEFERFLDGRALAAHALELTFRHGSHEATPLAVSAATPTSAARSWQRLIDAALERTPIGHEISRLELTSTALEPRRFDSIDLFDRSAQESRHWHELLALLRLRLGAEHIRPPRRQTTHLPESQDPARRATIDAPPGVRPLLLIDPPRRLSAREWQSLRPVLEHHQPERLCAPWAALEGAEAAAAEAGLARDYYIARLPDERTLWIFRDRHAREWFVQGVFA
ncbi:MAG: DNA polymerase Y family protein [Casimicrobiaceae bacterium]|nr:DNA polymerase Y family protein [Casimicrobiaceae bacterium]MDW8312002.1 DNA polymerase Y family protein [Burkholderiales bacterium]